MAKNIYGLVGYPLGHSFSRNFFSEKFTREGLDCEYLNFEIPSIDKIEGVVATPNLRGFNVTIPYKQQIIPYLDEIDSVAAEIGAVNVVKVLEGGKLKGFNSDIVGFRESIKPLLNGSHKKALVLGTGGASRAVVAGLKQLGIEPTLVSRKPGENILGYSDLTPEVMAEHTVIVNTTPLGMYPAVDNAPDIPYRELTQSHVCFDLVYNPEITKFMDLSRLRGAIIKNGLEMLHLQAIESWRIWSE